MSAEFIDTNILVYTHDGGAGRKPEISKVLLSRLFEGSGTLSIPILAEFYAAATRKLGMEKPGSRDIIHDLSSWTIHRAGYGDLLRASQLQGRYQIGWWAALVVNGAIELGAECCEARTWLTDSGYWNHHGAKSFCVMT